MHRLQSGDMLVVDCQSDLLAQLNTRLVVPLLSREDAPGEMARLNPTVAIDGREYVVATQLAAAVLQRELGDALVSLQDRAFDIVGALDVLIGGV